MTHNKPGIYCILKAESRRIEGDNTFKNVLVQECPKYLKSCIPCWIAVRKRQLKELNNG